MNDLCVFSKKIEVSFIYLHIHKEVMKLVSGDHTVVIPPQEEYSANIHVIYPGVINNNNYDPSLVLTDDFYVEELSDNTFAIYTIINGQKYYLDNSGSIDIVVFRNDSKGILKYDEVTRQIHYHDNNIFVLHLRPIHTDSNEYYLSDYKFHPNGMKIEMNV